MNSKKGDKYRQAVFIVTYKKEKNKVSYLLLKRKLHWQGWEFPKGGIEKSETPMQAVICELKEETGQNPVLIKSYKYQGKYSYDSKTKKDKLRKNYKGQTFTLFSAQISSNKIKIDKNEHAEYKWLSYEQARNLLTWVDQKNSLKIVDKEVK